MKTLEEEIILLGDKDPWLIEGLKAGLKVLNVIEKSEQEDLNVLISLLDVASFATLDVMDKIYDILFKTATVKSIYKYKELDDVEITFKLDNVRTAFQEIITNFKPKNKR